MYYTWVTVDNIYMLHVLHWWGHKASQVEHGKTGVVLAALWLQGHLTPFVVVVMCVYYEGDMCSVCDLPSCAHTQTHIFC